MKAFLEKIVGPVYAKLFARPAFYPLNKAIYHLGLRGMGMQNCTPTTSGERHFLKNMLPELLKTEAPVLFDVGANTGSYSEQLHKYFPSATIHAIEPHPVNFAKLSEKVGSFAQCHNCGLGDTKGSFVLYDRASNDGSTHASLHEKVFIQTSTETVKHTIAVNTLDEIAKENGIDHVDFLKIDTEGHEFAVLQGARQLLSDGKVSVIQFEFGGCHCFSRHFIYDFKELLPNHDLYRLLPGRCLKLDLPLLETEVFAFQNIVALPRK
jgi:FkbM family methyltransferase